MKKLNGFFFITALCTALAISSCKKTGDPGPAGTDGTNGSGGLPYKQAGTILNLSGNFYSDNAAFNNSYTLPFFAALDENNVIVGTETAFEGETEIDTLTRVFNITRRDSLNNSILTFQFIAPGVGDSYISYFHFNVLSNITSTSYKRIYTTSAPGTERTSGYTESTLGYGVLNSDGNTMTFSNLHYNPTSETLSFDYSGTLTGNYNSTGNTLTLSGTVKANVKVESLRRAK